PSPVIRCSAVIIMSFSSLIPFCHIIFLFYPQEKLSPFHLFLFTINLITTCEKYIFYTIYFCSPMLRKGTSIICRKRSFLLNKKWQDSCESCHHHSINEII